MLKVLASICPPTPQHLKTEEPHLINWVCFISVGNLNSFETHPNQFRGESSRVQRMYDEQALGKYPISRKIILILLVYSTKY